MADVWYEPKPDVKPQNAFSFDECIGLMVDTVQAYGHELVNVRIQSAAMRHMMHVLESHIAGEVEEDDGASLDGHQEIPLTAYISTAQTIAKKMYRPEINFEDAPDLKIRIDSVKAHLSSTPRPSTADDSAGAKVGREELDLIRKTMTEMSFQIEEQRQALEDQKASHKEAVDELNAKIVNQTSAPSSPTSPIPPSLENNDATQEDDVVKKQLDSLKREVKRLSSELDSVRKNAIVPVMPVITEGTEPTSHTTTDSLSKEETIKVVSDALQLSTKNIIQQATQAAEITTSEAINSALKQANQASSEANDKAQQALKEVEEFKEKEKMNELMASRDRTAAKNSAKASSKAEIAAKKAEKSASEVSDKCAADIDQMKNELMRFKNMLDRCDQDIIKINGGMAKNTFMDAIGGVTGGSPKLPADATDNAAPAAPVAPIFNVSSPEAQASLQRLDSAANGLANPDVNKDAIDIIGMELWKIREEVLQLATKSNDAIANAASDLDEKNRKVLEKSREVATRAAEDAIEKWEAERRGDGDDDDIEEKQLSTLIPETVAAEMKKYEAKQEESMKKLMEQVASTQSSGRHGSMGQPMNGNVDLGHLAWEMDNEGEDWGGEGGSWGGGAVVTGSKGGFIDGIGAGDKIPKKIKLKETNAAAVEGTKEVTEDSGAKKEGVPVKKANSEGGRISPLADSVDDGEGSVGSVESKPRKLSLLSVANTVVSDERKKRKTMLRGKPDRNNTLMDRIEGLELQQVEGNNAVETMKKMMKRLDQFQTHMMSMNNQTKIIPTIQANVQTLQVETKTLVDNSGPDMLAIKEKFKAEMEEVFNRLEVLENMGELYTDFAATASDDGEEDASVDSNKKRIKNNPIVPPKNVPLREVMLSLRDTAAMSEKKPGEFIWVYDGALETMRKEIRELNSKLGSGFSNLRFRVQQQSDFIGDFDEMRGKVPPSLDENTEAGLTPSLLIANEGSSPKSLSSIKMDNEETKQTSEEERDGGMDDVESDISLQSNTSPKTSPKAKISASSPKLSRRRSSSPSNKTSKKNRGPRTLKDRLDMIEEALSDLSATGKTFAENWDEQKTKVGTLVDNILTLNGDMGAAKKKLSTLEGGSGMKDELQRVAEQMADLFDKNSGIAQKMSGKADTQAVHALMSQLADYSAKAQSELSKLAGESDAKISEAQEEMKRQLAFELEQALLNMPKSEGTSALLRGYCLSCNQQVPRAQPKYPRLLANPHLREGDLQHGDNGPDLFDGAGSLDASLASSSVVSSQLSHAEKVDVMGGGFRLQPPHERFESQAAMPPKSAPITKQMMKKGGGRDALMMKQKIQREGTVGRLQPMLPVPGNNQSSMELDFSNNSSGYGIPTGMPSGAGVAPFGRKLMPWEKEGDPMSMSDSRLSDKRKGGGFPAR